MSRTIVVLATLILITFVIISVIAHRAASRAAAKMESEGKKVHQRGERYGRTRTTDECLSRSLRMLGENDSPLGELRARHFLAGCLDTAAPTRDFCDDFPATGAKDQTGWLRNRCADSGQTSERCARALRPIVDHCSKRDSYSN